MKLKNAVVAVVLAVAAAAVAYYYLRPTEEARVKAVFARASSVISKESGESIIVTAARTKDIADLVAENCQISVPEFNVGTTLTRSEVSQQVTMLRSTCTSLSVRFEDVRVDPVEGAEAHVTADLLVSGTGIDSFLSGRDTREVDALLVKSPEDGKWRFSTVNIDEIVDR